MRQLLFRGVCGISGLLVATVFGVAATPAADEPKDPKGKPTNRLAKESSPYLLQHAHNPVDWFPWGEEAFAKAKKEGKLVFLSIGYSSCHWCHVMEKESFANAEVAKLMNQWFVCIKVDREERPDVDHIYMTALHVRGKRGGWPLSMFLTAEGKPIWGGTYWPPDDKEIEGEKVLGFKSIVKLVHDHWIDKPKEILADADSLAEATSRSLAGALRGIALVELDRALVTAAVDELKGEFDKVHGGFGLAAAQFRGTKFPTPPYLRLLQGEAARTKSAELAGMVNLTLDKMALGGIYDHLGGGFHRYSTERTWTVPHFEKMLYDNAQLVELYAEAYRTTKNPLYRRVIAETLEFIKREMTDKDGGFYAALDADSEGEEGKFYVWTSKEIDTVLGDKLAAIRFKESYAAQGDPNFEGQYYILRLDKPLADAEQEKKLAPWRQKLFEARAKRPRPFLDTKVLTSWNGQMIAGYALAGQVLENKEYIAAAARAANFVLQKLRTKDGRLLRTYSARPGAQGEARLNAYIDDYAYLVHGLLALHEATKDKKWLDEAQALTDKMIELFGDKERGGFFHTSHDHEKLFARAKDQYDGAQPSGNSVAARNLAQLWVKTGDDKYRALAEKSFKTFAGGMKTSPTSLTGMVEALALYLDQPQKK
ncbi:hypothetical protein AYO44_17090 [Planctomycetaceae bacterium SCGC AG-212-F19]|nr:hypothetical protein AYO44_17090 [Planctomycetaceae bacterium SCGC AG-212-F19]